jgi:non-ribosomal peptide synthetase component E (peptide arylation enzyme)
MEVLVTVIAGHPTEPAHDQRFVDLVPAATRRLWSSRGWYPDEDLYSLFARHVARDPHRAAVIDTGGETSYGELDRLVRQLAVGLAALGVRAGDVVGVQLPNSRLSCAIDLAVAALGAVVLPFPVGRGDRDILSLLGRAQVRVGIAATDYRGFPCARRTLELADRLPALRAVVAVGEQVPAGCVPIGLLLASDSGEFRHQWPEPNGPARVLVSSGSEAEPKMVVYSHNTLAGARGRIVRDFRGAGPDFRAFFLVPLGSAFGGYGTPATICGNGGTMVVAPRFDPAEALGLIESAAATHLLGVPTMMRRLLELPALGNTELSSLRAVVLGGSALDRGTIDRVRASMGCAVINLYGSADGVTSHIQLDDPSDRTVTAGRPDPAVCQIRLVDEQLRTVPVGTVGEIIGHGPSTPMSYLAAPELNTEYRLPGGWVRSGDLGRFDADGYLMVVGRRKDVVIRGGANISPAEVESLLLAHPAISDVACVAVPDPVYGERMCCCVASRSELTLAELCDYLRGRGLEPRKLPERLLLLPRLPIGAAGKVDRRALQQQAAAAHP